jgi:hypothetical protein
VSIYGLHTNTIRSVITNPIRSCSVAVATATQVAYREQSHECEGQQKKIRNCAARTTYTGSTPDMVLNELVVGSHLAAIYGTLDGAEINRPFCLYSSTRSALLIGRSACRLLLPETDQIIQTDV